MKINYFKVDASIKKKKDITSGTLLMISLVTTQR